MFPDPHVICNGQAVGGGVLTPAVFVRTCCPSPLDSGPRHPDGIRRAYQEGVSAQPSGVGGEEGRGAGAHVQQDWTPNTTVWR